MALTSQSTAARCAAANEENPTKRAARAAAYKTWLDAQDDLEQAREALLAATARGWYSGTTPVVIARAHALLAEVSVELVPTITSMTPNTGILEAGGQTITVVGKDFTPATTFKVATVAATGVVFIDSQHMTFVTPAIGSSGAKGVVATNVIGDSTGTHNLTYA